MFVLAPLLLLRRTQRWTIRQKYQRAARWAGWAGILHPFDGVPQQSQYLRALSLSETGEIDQAVSTLHQLEQTAPPRTARLAAVHARRLADDWPGLLDWMSKNIPPYRILREPGLLPMWIRALGETGQLPAMLENTWAGKLSLHPQMAFFRSLCRMYAFAFCGQTPQLRETFATTLRHMPASVQQFWLATSEYAAGNVSAADKILTGLQPNSNADLRLAIQRRRATPPLLAEMARSPADRVLLEQLELQQDHEQRFSPTLLQPKRPWMTYGLITVNVLVFIVEWTQGATAGHWIIGGTMTDEVLYRLGALVPDALPTHEYYRLFMANFLHYGYPHILMNMLALWILGPFVEFNLGRWTYLAFYLASGICVMLTVLFLQARHWMQPEILVGASGAIMAIIGATAAILLRGWYRERATAALRRLGAVGTMLLLQVTFDHFTPQVSGAAHLAGIAWGFVLASLIPHKPGKKPSSDPARNLE